MIKRQGTVFPRTSNPDNGRIVPSREIITSANLPDRIHLLSDVLSKLFLGLIAVAQLNYGPSQVLWDMSIDNHGGYLTIILSKGKVIEEDCPII